MSVTVDYQVRSGSIYGFSKQVASEKGIYFQSLSGNSVLNRSIVQESQPEISFQIAKRILQPRGEPFRVMNECFHLGLAESTAAGSCESSAKPRGPGYSYRLAVHRDRSAVLLKDHDAYFFEELANQSVLIAMIVMVSEHGDYRHVDGLEQRGERNCLVRASMRRKIACQQEQICMQVQLGPISA
jgi:hypothetical protein